MQYKSVIPSSMQFKLSSPKSIAKSNLSATLQDSPSLTRMKQLQDKWQNLQAELESDKISRISSLENTLNSIIEKYNQEKPIVAAKFLLIKENLTKVSEQLDCEKNDEEVLFIIVYIVQLLDSKLTLQMKTLEEGLINKIEDQKIGKSKDEGLLLKDLDKKFSDMNYSIQYNNKSYTQQFQDQQNVFYDHVLNLKNLLQQQSQKRTEGANYLVIEIENEIKKFQELFQKQKKFREDSQQKLVKQIESLTKLLFTQISKEELDRKKSTENLLKLLEDTCSRLDKSFRS